MRRYRLTRRQAVATVGAIAMASVAGATIPSSSSLTSHGTTSALAIDKVAQQTSGQPSVGSSLSASAFNWQLPAPPQAQPPTGDATNPAKIPAGPLGIPGIAMDAYRKAADRLAIERPGCNLAWTDIAGIGQVESQHAAGRFDARGNTLTRIVGPRLDGSLRGTQIITDSDGGSFDGDTEFDRAVGPVQFLPSTWVRMGLDGNGDGAADPNNVYDSAYSTGAYLCSSGGAMDDPRARTQAILTYNNSLAYVANVNAWALGYAINSYPLLADLPSIHPDASETEAARIEAEKKAEEERIKAEEDQHRNDEDMRRIEESRLRTELDIKLSEQAAEHAEKERLAIEANSREETPTVLPPAPGFGVLLTPPPPPPPHAPAPPFLPPLPCIAPFCAP